MEFRIHRTVLYNSIYRADDQLLVNTYLFGVTAAHAPVWHLRKLPAGELASLVPAVNVVVSNAAARCC